jgi:hypothetical protein
MERMVRVIDIPKGMPAEDAERLLHEPYEDGFYLMHVYPLEGAATHRAYFKHRVIKDEPVRDRDGQEQRALAVIADYRNESSRKLVTRLRALGIKRSQSWVYRKRAELQMPHL